MNVRITPRLAPQRTESYSGIARVVSDGRRLTLEGDPSHRADRDVWLTLNEVAELALDEDGAIVE